MAVVASAAAYFDALALDGRQAVRLPTKILKELDEAR